MNDHLNVLSPPTTSPSIPDTLIPPTPLVDERNITLMLPRNIAVHLRNIPRPAALTRPSYPLHPSLSACRAQLPPIRNYSATPTDAAEASSSAQSSGSSSGSSPPQAWENERNDAESKIAGLEAKVKDLEVSRASCRLLAGLMNLCSAHSPERLTL